MIKMDCDSCKSEADVAFCDSHYSEALAESYEQGYNVGKREAQAEINNN